MTTKGEQEALWARVYAALTPERRRVADDVLKRGLDNARQQLSWVGDLLALADSLIAAGLTPIPWPFLGMFWIRLHGVMTELVEENRLGADIAATLNERQLIRSLSKFSLALFTDGRAMLATLDEQEAVVADYLRQRSAHMRQDAYSLKEMGNGAVRDTRRIAHLEKTFTIEDVDRMRADVLRTHGSEAAFAHHVAVKVRPAAARMFATLQELHSLPQW